MNSFWLYLIHQALFGGIAAAGFGVLFNCPPAMLVECFASGAVALAVRTSTQSAGLSLPEAAFFAALTVAVIERVLQHYQSKRGSILAVVGCIPMVPGSLAADGLTNLFLMLNAREGEDVVAAAHGMKNLLMVAITLAAIGTALAIPRLIYPRAGRDQVATE
ncbi:MAG: threonine/serine exporter family protein [Verrucomicrobia bacterium]|nr:threonine/serine exporter family protein [Verrucomicrobiota bacterium]